MEWAFKNRMVYIGGLLLIFIIIFSLPVYRFLNKEPTCFDGKQNGNELGIDCGGSCSNVCKEDAESLVILWSRSFKIREGVYNSIAMIENQNLSAGAYDVPYTFRLFDERNILVYERKGKVNIPAQTRFPIFEGAIVTGERIPQKTFFEFTNDIDWVQQTSLTSELVIKNQEILNTDSSPRIDVEVLNRGLKNIKNLELFVVVYDLDGNAMAGSKTFIDSIKTDKTVKAFFTWPDPFLSQVGRIEVIPKFETIR